MLAAAIYRGRGWILGSPVESRPGEFSFASRTLMHETRVFGHAGSSFSGEELDLAAFHPSGHPKAVELDLVHPVGAGRRFPDQLGKLRRDPAR